MDPRQVGFLVFAAVVLGTSVGFAAHEVAFPRKPSSTLTQIVEPILTPEDLAEMCMETRQTDRELLTQAQDQVTALRTTLDAWESELVGLRTEARVTSERDAVREARIDKLEKQVAWTRHRLEKAEAERNTLATELEQTLAVLDLQIVETEQQTQRADRFEQMNVRSRWRSFLAEAKVEICDKGTRKRHERCHDAVQAALGPRFEERFSTCLLSGQASPSLGQLVRDARLPATAIAIRDSRDLGGKGWYVDFCDPELPEASADLADP